MKSIHRGPGGAQCNFDVQCRKRDRRIGLESLEAINHRLGDGGIGLHLSEVKGPVMDRLKRTHFLEDLSGKVFLSQDRAFAELVLDDGGRAKWMTRNLLGLI